MESLRATLFVLLDPLGALLDPGRRIFWPFLLGALLLAAAVHRWTPEQHGVSLLRFLFPRRLWLHPSARLDYKLLLVQALLRATLFAPRLLSTLTVSAVVALWLRRTFGSSPAAGASALQVTVLYTLTAFVLDDWSRYCLHRLLHRVPWLWELHKVHHSAEVLTPFSLYRTHPLESLLSNVRSTLTIGATTGLFLWLFGQRIRGWEVLGVDAIGFFWSLLGANLRHSHVWLSYGPRLEHLLMSPAQHQIHHSTDARHADSNFGTVLALWDWLGGTLYVTRGRERLRFGLPLRARNHGLGVTSVLVAPVAAAVRVLGDSLGRPWRRAWAAAGLGALLLLPGCATKRVDRGALIQAFGECALETYRDFARAAGDLAAATRAAADRPEPATRAAARAAWARAMDLWQQAEALQFGPAASAPSPGAQGLRNAMYAWPDVNRCLIEQQLVSRIYEGELLAAVPDSSRGLAAVEYLLFYEGTDNACAPDASINTMGSWRALGAEELARRKAAYAGAAAADVALRAQALVAAWEPGQGNFFTQLTTAGRGSTQFATQQQALNAVAEALFYLDSSVKDRKLAQPLGLRDCEQQTCPEALESPWAERGKAHLQNNLFGSRKLLLGCGAEGTGLGFDDLLVAAGAEDTAASLRRDLEGAFAAVAALGERTLRQALAVDRPAVQRVHDAIKRITDTLKGDFILLLQITPPKRVEGDQD